MQPSEYKFRIEDILVEIATVSAAMKSVREEAYVQNLPLRRMVERCVEIISEACRHLPAEVTHRYPDVPWKSIRAIGNILRHEYGRVDDHLIWRIATVSLPELQHVMQEILASLPPESAP